MILKVSLRYKPVSMVSFSVRSTLFSSLKSALCYIYGIETHRCKYRDLDDIRKSCTIGRGQLMLQADPENSIWSIKHRKRKLQDISFDVPQASICVSYTSSRSFGPLDPCIEEMYIVTSLSKITDILCEVTCVNHSFFLAFLQPFSSEKYLECFLEELHYAGLHCELLRSEPLLMCGVDPGGILFRTSRTEDL